MIPPYVSLKVKQVYFLSQDLLLHFTLYLIIYWILKWNSNSLMHYLLNKVANCKNTAIKLRWLNKKGWILIKLWEDGFEDTKARQFTQQRQERFFFPTWQKLGKHSNIFFIWSKKEEGKMKEKANSTFPQQN